MAQDKSNREHIEPVDAIGATPTIGRPIWKRVPTGWVVLALVILAWIGGALVWNGVLFLTRL